MSARGQVTSLEFFVVTGIVALAITASFYIYDLTASRTSEAHLRVSTELAAIEIMDSLVKTSGIPGDWESDPSLTTSFGLADSPIVLDKKKVSAFVAFDYDQARKMMGIDNYQYFFSVKMLNGTTINKSGASPVNARMAVNPRMTAILDGNAVYVDLLVWR